MYAKIFAAFAQFRTTEQYRFDGERNFMRKWIKKNSVEESLYAYV